MNNVEEELNFKRVITTTEVEEMVFRVFIDSVTRRLAF